MKLDFYLVKEGTKNHIDIEHKNKVLGYELPDYKHNYNYKITPEPSIFAPNAIKGHLWYDATAKEYHGGALKLATHNLLTQYSLDYAVYYYQHIVDIKQTYPEYFI